MPSRLARPAAGSAPASTDRPNANLRVAITSGCVRAEPSTHSISVASRRRRCCSGDNDDGGYSGGSDRFSSGASSGIASAGASPTAVSRDASCATGS